MNEGGRDNCYLLNVKDEIKASGKPAAFWEEAWVENHLLIKKTYIVWFVYDSYLEETNDGRR